MPITDRLDVTHAQLLVIDLQQRMLPHIAYYESVIENSIKMIRAAREMDLTITISEQYPKGLGPTDPRVLEAAGAEPAIIKNTFSVCADEKARQLLSSNMRPRVLIVGVETHVCVQQTALDLLSMQMRPFIVADAIGSRKASDRQFALERMRDAGAVITTVESAIFELLHEAGTDLFKRVQQIVK
ncbi:MAG: hydrolase [Phycisphaerae bacterium]|nr:hydrolase [Phycisphaerae bacterium]